DYILPQAVIRAQPPRLSPSEGPRRRQRGAYSRIGRRSLRLAGAWLLGSTARGALDEGIFAMPKNKDLKRLIRARMQKTGESYTTARLHTLDKKSKEVPQVPATEPPHYATVAGMSDEAVKKATGCTWVRWVAALDHVQATEMSHREIA